MNNQLFSTILTQISIPLTSVFYENEYADRVVHDCSAALRATLGWKNAEGLVSAEDQDSVRLIINVPIAYDCAVVAEVIQRTAQGMVDRMRPRIAAGR